MQLNARQQNIIDMVKRQGFVSIEPLAHVFDVTPQTVRRDGYVAFLEALPPFVNLPLLHRTQ